MAITKQALGELKDVKSTKAAPTKALPKPDGDFYSVREILSKAEQDKLKQVRDFLESKVAPVIDKYWGDDAFPFEIVPGIRDLSIAGLGYEGYGCAGGTTLFAGFVTIDLPRAYSPTATSPRAHPGP